MMAPSDKGTDMLRSKTIVAITMLAVLSGCAGYRPMVDMQGRSQAGYEADVASCQQYAEGVSPAASTAAGAIFSAALGAGIALASGGRLDVGRSAAMSAVLGGAGGGLAGAGGQRDVIMRCMAGRGWNVLR